MTAEYGPFARRTFTSADVAEHEDAGKPVAAAERRSFAAPEDEFRAEERTLSATAEDTMFPGAPLYARKSKKKDAGAVIPKAAMIAAPAVLLAAGAIFLMSRPAPDGLFAESATPTTNPPPAAAPPAEPPAGPTAREAARIQQASTPPAPAVAPRAAEPRTPVRTAAAASAPPAVAADDPQTWATDASATMPAAPIPYSALGQTPAPSMAAAAPPLLTPEPAAGAAAVTPLPVTPDPAETSTPAAQESMEEPTP